MITRLKKTIGHGIAAIAAMLAIVGFSGDANAQIWWQGPCPPPGPAWGPSGYWSPGLNIGSSGVSFSISFGSGGGPSYYPVPGYGSPVIYNPPIYNPQPAPPVSPPPRQPIYHFPHGNGWTLSPGRLPGGVPGRL